jgi:hypothetical protein
MLPNILAFLFLVKVGERVSSSSYITSSFTLAAVLRKTTKRKNKPSHLLP